MVDPSELRIDKYLIWHFEQSIVNSLDAAVAINNQGAVVSVSQKWHGN